jgi:hypothetical protein
MRFETDLLMAPTRSGPDPCSLLLNFYPFFGILNFLILNTKEVNKVSDKRVDRFVHKMEETGTSYGI